MQDELVEDLIAIVTSFSGRVHGMRGIHVNRAGGTSMKPDPVARAIAKAISAAVRSAIEAVARDARHHSQIHRSRTG